MKVAVPPGVNGLQPEVVLRYNAGSGNGPFGLAWDCSPMSIQRQVEKGVPTYTPSDVFSFGGEELVPLSDGSYRSENESGFMHVARAGDGEGWEVRDKSGRKYKLGTFPNAREPNRRSRTTRPEGSSFLQSFRWCVDEVVDTHGNRMEYHYTTFPDSPGELYLTEIRYSIFGKNYHSVSFDYESRGDVLSSFLAGFEIRTARRCSQIRVESRGSLVRRYTLSYVADPQDSVEAIPAADAGLGFSLLRKCTQWDNRTPSSSYLPPLRFGYTRLDTSRIIRGSIQNAPPFSIGNPSIALADINCDGLPDFFHADSAWNRHEVYYNLGDGLFGAGTVFQNSPAGVGLESGNTELADFDGDGRVDIVQKAGAPINRFVFFPNTTKTTGNDDTRPKWGPETPFPGPSPGFDLDDPAVRTLDLDNDKRIDFMRTTPWGFVYWFNRPTGWEEKDLVLFGEASMGDIQVSDGVDFSKPGDGGNAEANELVRLADMNGDRLLDLVRLNVFGNRLEITFWPNAGRAAWGERVTMGGELDLGVVPVEDVFIRDVNGDGVADCVAVAYDTLHYWINQGSGRFSSRFTIERTPPYLRGQTVLTQADINGNGSTDFLWENFDEATGSYRTEFIDLLGDAKANLLAVIDNGIGLRTDISYQSATKYYAAARKANQPWQTRLPFPTTVVSKISRSFGLDLDAVPGPDAYISEFSYSDGYYDGFEKEFRGFAFAKRIDRGDDQFLGSTNEIPIHSPSTVTRIRFHTGTPDLADNDDNGVIDDFDARSGYEEEPIKGRVIWTEVTLPTADFGGPHAAPQDGEFAPDSIVFTREINTWQIKTIHSPSGGFTYRDAFGGQHPTLSLPFATTDGKKVRLAFLASTTRDLIEANGALRSDNAVVPIPSRLKKTLLSEYDVDFYGNTIATRNYGDSSANSVADDERFTFQTFAFNLGSWLIGLSASELVTDEHGLFVAQTRKYYDGLAFVGLPFGQVGLLGEFMREERLLNGTNVIPALESISTQVGDPRRLPGAAVQAMRVRYDTFGNVVEVRDPLYSDAAGGHAREFTYDPIFHTFVERETIHVGDGKADLVASAGYDYGAGVLLRMEDFNDNATTFRYDFFWRLVSVVKPGDESAFPTQIFTYRPGDTFRGVYYDYDTQGNLALANSADTVVSSVTVRAREQPGTGNTFDTISFSDGAGHKLGVASEGDVPGQWIFKDVKRYTSGGQERDAYLPFLANAATYQEPPVNLGRIGKFYDSLGRVTRTTNPPEENKPGARVSETRAVYLPLENVLYDEEDSNPASPHYLTPHVQHQDGLGRLVGVDEVVKLNDDGTGSFTANTWSTRYKYNLNDQLVHTEDSQGNRKWFRYDGLSRRIFMNDPDRGIMEFTYDDASNLIQSTDAKSQRITYFYDGVNRIRAEDYQDEGKAFSANLIFNPSLPLSVTNRPDVVYFYDTPVAALDIGNGTTAIAQNTKGFRAYVWDLSGEEHTSYDSRGRVSYTVKSIKDPVHHKPVNYRTGFEYDSLDRVTRVTYPDDDYVFYEYNARALLERIHGGQVVDALGTSNIIANIDYRVSDQLAQIDYGNGVRTTYDYDPRLRLSSLVTGNPSRNSEFINFAYNFDGASNIRRISDRRTAESVPAGDKRRNTQIFDHDDLYRLTRVQYSFEAPGQALRDDGFVSYRYDRIGNMLTQTSDINHIEKGLSVTDLGSMLSGGTAGRFGRNGRGANTPPGPHALTSIQNPRSAVPNREYLYDSNGNMLIIDGLTNTWDFKDRLVAVENGDMRADYAYDHTDRRISKRIRWKTPLKTLGYEFATDTAEEGKEVTTTTYVNKFAEVRQGNEAIKYIWNGDTRVARLTAQLSPGTRVQRLRYSRGWNLLASSVSGAQLPSSPSPFQTSLRWDQLAARWRKIASSEALDGEVVIWMQCLTDGTLDLFGLPVAAGDHQVNGTGFLPGSEVDHLALLSAVLQRDVDLWAYDAANQLWRRRPPASGSATEYLSRLSSGEGIFVRTSADKTIPRPDLARSIRFWHQDHLGNSSNLTDGKARVLKEVSFYPFGPFRSVLENAKPEEGYMFTQKERDSETAFYYFESRYLSAVGSFLSVDPVSRELSDAMSPQTMHGVQLMLPQNLNPYVYAMNRPLVVVDPSGRFGVLAGAGVGAGVGAVFGGFAGFVQEFVREDGDQDLWRAIGAGAVGGAVAGAIAGGAVGIAVDSVVTGGAAGIVEVGLAQALVGASIGSVGGAAGNVAGLAVESWINPHTRADPGAYAAAATTGALFGAFGGTLSMTYAPFLAGHSGATRACVETFTGVVSGGLPQIFVHSILDASFHETPAASTRAMQSDESHK